MSCPHCQPREVACDAPRRATPNDHTSERRRRLWRWTRIGIGALLAAWGMVLGLAINTSEAGPETRDAIHLVLGAMAGIALVLLGGRLVVDTLHSLRRGRLTLEPLFLSALLGAAGYSALSVASGIGAVYFETVIVVLVIYSLGRELTAGIRTRADAAIDRLGSGPSRVRLVTASGVTQVDADAIKPGDQVEVRPGEEIPVDGAVMSGYALVQRAILTGEPIPVAVSPGDRVLAGTYPLDAMLRIRAFTTMGSRRIDRALGTIGKDLLARSRIARSAERVLRWFVPMVWAASLATLVAWWKMESIDRGIINALAVLLIACPCALGFATPTALWAACVALGRLGVLVRDPDVIEPLARVDTLAIDKTGTVTDRTPQLTSIEFVEDLDVPRPDVLAMLAAVQRRSQHPVASAFAALGHTGPDEPGVDSLEVVPGRGVLARVELGTGAFHDVWIGPVSALERDPFTQHHELEPETRHLWRLVVTIDGRPACLARVDEQPRPSWERAASELRTLGIRIVVMTGDEASRARRIDADEHHASMLPDEKRALILDLRETGRTVGFVGDGINDAPALAAADASIAIGDGAPVASSTAQATIDPDRLDSLPGAIPIAGRAMRVLRSNLWIAIGYNTIGIGLAAAGLLHPVLAASIMVVSSVLVTARSMSIADPGRWSGRTRADALRASGNARFPLPRPQ